MDVKGLYKNAYFFSLREHSSIVDYPLEITSVNCHLVVNTLECNGFYHAVKLGFVGV